MITEPEIEQLKKVFVTKEEFNVAISSVLEAINSMGKMIIKEMREGFGKHDYILDNHESRIRRLEGKIYS